jgi:hypothetical protein
MLVLKKLKAIVPFFLSKLETIVLKYGIATDPNKIKVILDWPLYKNLRQLKGFLRLTGYYRRFVKRYNSICKPLT